MAVTKEPRPNLGASGSIRFIDGFSFEGLGSAGFDDNDFLFIGDGSDDLMEGGDGHDELEGEDGADILKGGAGNDTLEGDDGNDDLDGQEGTDKLFGGNGDDIMRVGGSKPVIIETGSDGKPTLIQGDFDRLIGGDGNDTFGFYGYGSFEITDFTVGEDRLFFDSEILGIHSIDELVPFITDIIYGTKENALGETVPYSEVEFIDGAATIRIVNVASIDEITADMVMFHL